MFTDSVILKCTDNLPPSVKLVVLLDGSDQVQATTIDRLVRDGAKFDIPTLIEASPECVVSVTYTSGSTQS